MEKDIEELKIKYFELIKKGNVGKAREIAKEYFKYLDKSQGISFDKDDILIAYDAGYEDGYYKGLVEEW